MVSDITMAAVNKPTNLQTRDASIDQKLQLFGIYNGFKMGKVPSVCTSIIFMP